MTPVRSCSWHENRGAFEPSGAQIGERLVGFLERITRRLGDDTDFRCQAQEIDSVPPRQIGDRYQLPLMYILSTGVA